MEVLTTWHNSQQVCHNQRAGYLSEHQDQTNWHAEVTSSVKILLAISGRLSMLLVAWCHASMISVTASPHNYCSC